jgi:DNA-binding CsgD family transcriptional regulator
MIHHKKDSLKYDLQLAKKLRPLAANRKVSQKQAAKTLGVDVLTVVAMLKVHSIPWVSAAHSRLSERSVREALQGRSSKEAADFLGVHHQTLRNHYDHLLKKRASPGKLDAHKEEIHSLAKHIRSAQIAEKFGVNPITVRNSIQRWAKSEPDEWSEICEFQRSRLGIRWNKKRKA